ncbi:MAG: hypothetical protein OXC28_08705 [Defluviicoccus sp.]|nr:hypothetical protein [Defluviicoccus sp.]
MSETAISRMRADLEAKRGEAIRKREELSSLEEDIDHLQVALSVIEKYEEHSTAHAPANKFRAKGIQSTIRDILVEVQPRSLKRSEIINLLQQRLGKEISGKSVSNALVILGGKKTVVGVGGGRWKSAETSVDRDIQGMLGETQGEQPAQATLHHLAT